jgi:hypothetical protein
MKILDLINTLATKAGKQNEQAIRDLLSRADLQNIDLADEVAIAINNSLLTVDGAKNNPLLKSHFTALALGSADTEILNTIKTLELGDDIEREITGTANTYEKQRKLTAKLKETVDALKAAKGDGNGKDIEKYTKQINELNAQVSQLKESTVAKSELDTLKQQHNTQLINLAVGNKLSGLNFANTSIPKDVNILTAKSLLEKSLNGKAIIVRDENGDLKLKRANDPALDYYDESQKAVSFDDFTNKILAENKLLAVSGVNPNNPHQQIVIPGGGKIDTTNFNAALNSSLGDLKQE